MLHVNVLQQNGFVIQRGTPYPIRGVSIPGDTIKVSYKRQKSIARADEKGNWVVWLEAMNAAEPDSLIISSRNETLVIDNVCVGDVWVCAGQSNMEMSLRDTDTGMTDAGSAYDSHLRIAKISTRVETKPISEVKQILWQETSPSSASAFSAIGYYFGAYLRNYQKIPIGLIQCAVGATPAEAWTPRHILDNDSDYDLIFERWRRSIEIYPDPEKTYEKAFAKWDKEADLAEKEGRPIPGAFPKLIGPDHPWTPSGLYNGMIHPLTFFPIKGVIWYQGEAAPERAYQYRKLFRSLIGSWREAWINKEFSFLYVQAANFGPRRNEPCEHSWAELREAQAMALSEPDTAMVVTIDTGEENNIHPLRKKPVGERLGMAARVVAYGEDNFPGLCPVYKKMEVENGKIRIWFSHTYGGLKTSDGGSVKGFAISAGATDFARGNRGFVWANAEIEGETIVVSSPLVRHPVAVRYGWAQNPEVNLTNSVGLPVSPFRSDNYPGVTYYNR